MRDILINATRSHLAGQINKHLANVEESKTAAEAW